MRRSTVERALMSALRQKYPQASLKKQDRKDFVEIADIVLSHPKETVAFEVKTSNFYDGLGRTILLTKKFDAAYLVVSNQLLPPTATLSLIPRDIGIVGFHVQDRIIRFEVIRQSGNHKLSSLSSKIEEGEIELAAPVRVSLVSPKALRIVRYLIAHKTTTQVQIARDTRVSVGMVNKVVSALVNRDLVSYRGKKLIVFDVWKLLNEISWNRPLKGLKKMELRLANAANVQEAETNLVKICNKSEVKYALTLFSGASKYVGYGMVYDSIQVYVDRPEQILDLLGQTRTDEGVLLELYGIDSSDITDEAKTVGGVVVCSPSQIVLDLVSYGRVGRDWAVKLYEATLSKGD